MEDDDDDDESYPSSVIDPSEESLSPDDSDTSEAVVRRLRCREGNALPGVFIVVAIGIGIIIIMTREEAGADDVRRSWERLRRRPGSSGGRDDDDDGRKDGPGMTLWKEAPTDECGRERWSRTKAAARDAEDDAAMPPINVAVERKEEVLRERSADLALECLNVAAARGLEVFRDIVLAAGRGCCSVMFVVVAILGSEAVVRERDSIAITRR